jgi:murein DD-endopeptidase MepM/ murein hydrolase activator NlpD
VRSPLLAALVLVPGLALAADDGAPDGLEASLFDQLNVREQVLDGQRDSADAIAREHALLTYRLLRSRELGFAANPEERLDNARTFDLALMALHRSVEETRALTRELDKVRADRSTLEAALVARALSEKDGAGAAGAKSVSRDRAPSLLRPVRGTPVAGPGVRRDGPTRIELHHDSLQILARLNDPVRAIAAGTIRRVEALPQGGFAVVVAHAGGLTSITTGLRDIAVRVGERVTAGQTVGIVGRNLDGAAVVSVEIWRRRSAADSSRLLRARLRVSG